MADNGVTLAETELREALELLDQLERQSLEAEPSQRPTPAQVVEQRALVEFAEGRVSVAKRRRAEALEAARKDGCTELGGRITAYHGELAGSKTAEVLIRGIAESVQRLADYATGHDGKLTGFAAEAGQLGAVYSARAEENYGLGQHGAGVQFGPKQLIKIGPNRLASAIQHAVAGRVDAAARELVTTADLSEAQTPSHYMRLGNDVIPIWPGRGLSPQYRGAVAMSQEEVAAWQAGLWKREPE